MMQGDHIPAGPALDALIGALARAAYERLRTEPVTMPDSVAAKQALPAQRPAA